MIRENIVNISASHADTIGMIGEGPIPIRFIVSDGV